MESKMDEGIKVGDLVTPISNMCGLWLADVPENGDLTYSMGYKERRRYAEQAA